MAWGYQTWLMDALADEFRGSRGFRVDYVPGWETRGKQDFNPLGVMEHHTGRGSYNAVLNWVYRNSPIAPLANTMTSRPENGVVRITVVSAGRANHAGRGYLSWTGRHGGNRHTLGRENLNDGREGWPTQQLEAMRRCAAVELSYLGRPTGYLTAHKLYAPDRKVDPHSWNVYAERRAVEHIMRAPEVPALSDMERLMASLNKQEQARLKEIASLPKAQYEALLTFARAVDELDSSGWGVAHAAVHDHRARLKAGWETGDADDYDNSDYHEVRHLLDALEIMDSSAYGFGRHGVAAIRALRAMELAVRPERVIDNRAYTSEELGLPPLG